MSSSSDAASVARQDPGGTVLLHDSDRTSAPGSWRTTLVASDLLLTDWSMKGYDVGPLRDHRPF